LTAPPVTCSGAANCGVSALPPSNVSWVALAGVDSSARSFAIPKSSSFTWPVTSYQHIGRLDIAMNNEVRMRMRNGTQHIEEEFDSSVYVEHMGIAVIMNGPAIHVLQ